jgi:lipoate---protein ligase
MALDSWLLEQHRLGYHPPTLRFYTWNPPAISLGYHQRRYPQTWQDLCWQGQAIDLVRRPSGGRAVLHQGDLTYAVITSGLQGNRTEVYQQICEFLIQGWRSLGINLHYGQAKRGYIHNPNCFGTATGADLVLTNGTKLIGNAQLYRGNGILQHGSIRLSTDASLYALVFGEALPPLELPIQLDNQMDTIVAALTNAASSCFGAEFVSQDLSDAEWQAVLTQPALVVG